MFFRVNRHLVALLCFGLQSYIRAKSVQVVTFKTNNAPVHDHGEKPSVNTLTKTKEISFCFRHMPRYHRRFSLIKTDEIELVLRGSENKHVYNLVFKSLNGNTPRISRMMPFSFQPGSFQPGKWFSHCFSMKFSQLKQSLTFILDGQKCFEKTFSVKEEHWLYYKNKPTLPKL